jgi:site-specific recombinase XerD
VQAKAEIPPVAAVSEPPVRKRKPRKDPKPVPKEEVDAIRRAINTKSTTGLRNRVMLDIWYRAGLRIAEVCDLGPRDIEIHDDGGVIRVIQGKGAKDRTVYFDTTVIGPELEAWKRERQRLGCGSSPYLFCTIRTTTTVKGNGVKGGRVSPRYLQDWVKRMAVRAGVDPGHITPHKFRHSFATETYEETSDIVLVQEQLGHSNLETTMVYTKIADATRKRKMQARHDPLSQ